MSLRDTKLMRNALASPRMVSVLKRLVPPLDMFLLRLTRGWLNTAMQPVVLLETLGAKSGQWRKTATLCMPLGKDMVVVGSNWGLAKDPAWVYNLRANSQPKVTFRGYIGPMLAEEIQGEARAAMWAQLVAHNPQYRVYAQMTERLIPVMHLKRPPH